MNSPLASRIPRSFVLVLVVEVARFYCCVGRFLHVTSVALNVALAFPYEKSIEVSAKV